MNKKFLIPFLLCFCATGVIAEDKKPSGANKDDPDVRRVIFSTSTDWESVSGLRLQQYNVKFYRDKSIGIIGWELYVMDGFPCIGQAETARVWIGPGLGLYDKSEARQYITCLYPPKSLKYAWRESSARAFQGTTRGILDCPVKLSGYDISVDLSKCIRTDWKDVVD